MENNSSSYASSFIILFVICCALYFGPFKFVHDTHTHTHTRGNIKSLNSRTCPPPSRFPQAAVHNAHVCREHVRELQSREATFLEIIMAHMNVPEIGAYVCCQGIHSLLLSRLVSLIFGFLPSWLCMGPFFRSLQFFHLLLHLHMYNNLYVHNDIYMYMHM